MSKPLIFQFSAKYEFLSNFYKCRVAFEGLVYQSSEAAYQAAKTQDQETKKKFTTLSAAEAKKLGRQVELRPDWEQIKIEVMTKVVEAKFRQNLPLAKRLLETGEAILVEGNYWGCTFWGMNSNDGCMLTGENHLGKILMQFRAILKEENQQ